MISEGGLSKTELPPTRRLCHEDTWLFHFEASVLAVEPERERAGGGEAGEAVEVALDQSAFYAESGGQPSDRGTLAGLPVTALRLCEGVLWHRIGDLTRGQRQALRPGARIAGEIDASFRLDAMRQHTAQHMLSQALVRIGGNPTVGFHLGREESTVDVGGPAPGDQVIAAVLQMVNSVVLEDRPVRVHQVLREDAGRFPLRRDPGAEIGILRVIEIEGFDWSACGGTHARRTGEVGPVHVLGTEKIRGDRRIRFLAGERVLRYLAGVHAIVEEIAHARSIRWDQAAGVVSALGEDASRLSREVKMLRLERGRVEGKRLLTGAVADEDGVRRLRVWLGDRSPDELRGVAAGFVEPGPAILLAGGMHDGRAQWVAARSAELPAGGEWNAAAGLRKWLQTMGGNGGGSAVFASGTAPGPPQNRITKGRGALE
jgi:alanyl-tRNA synthetase